MADKSDEQAKLLEDLRTLPAEVAADALLALRRERLLRDDILTRLLGPDAPALFEQCCGSVGDLLFEIARLEMKQIELVLDFSRKQSERLFEWSRKAVRKAPLQLQLKGFIGGSAQASLTIENTSAAKAPLAVQMDPPARGGTPIPQRHCRFQPDPSDNPQIDGGALRELAIAIVLHPLDFNPGPYAGDLVVKVGTQVTTVAVDLTVQPAPSLAP